ncbi:DUF1491 family protein [Ponticaulis koreensis]|uniref:DUF1491 family protein n=1 Tax=Ponticaulis koreensis TaxID=1123045 RepID=UPI0003B36D49|nr:DUF1491 family protein [Ponticaulis koreensis]
MNERLPTWLWVDALMRRASLGGAFGYVAAKGDKERGDAIVKVARLDGRAALFVRSPLSMDSPSFDWLPNAGEWAEEREIDELIQRRRSYDPDLWVVEIEDREGRHFLTEAVNGE